jgi:hypothetical protein
MRRALVMFAERMPELSVLGGCFALPGLLATAIGLLGTPLPFFVQPLLWVMVLLTAMLLATPVAMAGIAAIFGDLRERPFVTVTWQGAAHAVIGDSKRHALRGNVALYLAWVATAIRLYLFTSRSTKGNGVKNMLTFVDHFRHGGARTTSERLDAMAEVMPKRAFATMAIAQLAALALLPAAAILTTLGVTSLLRIPISSAMPLVGLAGGLAFSGALFLQVFIALVDVMLYDLAYDMTAV